MSTLTFLVIGTLAAASELTRRGSRYTAPDSPGRCVIVRVDEDNADVAEAFIDYDYWTLIEAIEDLFWRNGIRPEGAPFEACLTTEGILYGASTVDRRTDPDTGHPIIRFSITVEEESRRQGVAKRLVQSLLRQLPPSKYQVEAWVVNPTMAELLQDHFGFETHGGGDWSEADPFLVAPS